MPAMTSPELSVVVPLHNEEEGCAAFFEHLLPILEGVTPDYEVICVDDGSTDRTRQLVTMEHLRNPRVKLLDLSRNFGKEQALTAGLDHARGQAVIPLDADLQDPPEVIPDLVARWREGFDVVLAVRADRQSDTILKRVTARLFYRLMSRVSDPPIPADVGDFRLLDRRVVEALKLLPERTRFMKGLFAWLGFHHAQVEYARPARGAGTSKWRYWRLWNFALEGLVSFSTLPLRIWTYVKLLVAALALAFSGFIFARTLLFGTDVPGYASVVVLISFFSGINMIHLGIVGEYLARIYTETKQRPHYLVRNRLGFEEAEAAVAPGEAPLIAALRSRRGPA